MTTASIRGYTDADFAAARGLWAELTQHHRDLYVDQTIGGEDPGAPFVDHLADVGADNLWVAEMDGVVVGLVGLIRRGRSVEIEPVIVTRIVRGTGVGRRLVEHVMAIARASGAREVTVRPVARNADALAFFASLGLTTIGRVELFRLIDRPDRTWTPGATIHGVELDT